MEPKASLSCKKGSATDAYIEPDESNVHLQIPILQDLL
jgi:hypothetical protein